MRAASIFALTLLATFATAQTEHVARLSGTSKNVGGAGESIRINIYQWSTDAQRDALLAAWTVTRPAAAGAAGRGGARGARGGPGGAAGPAGARGARGGSTAPALPNGATAANPDPAFLAGLADPSDNLPADAPPLTPPVAGRGGRGGGAGAGGGETTPEGSLGAALKAAATDGVFGTSESVGYAIKYAHRRELPGGTEQIILITDRRVGASNMGWKPAPGIPLSDYPFSIIELRVNPSGKGEGKGVVTGKVVVDSNAKTFAVENYDALPAILQVERAK